MKRTLLLQLIAAMPVVASAQWNDVTEQMLQNPAFDNNSADGWDCWGFGNVNINYDAIESFNGWFDFSQKITAPAGDYRLSCQAYYRMGSHNDAYAAHIDGSEDILAVLYANQSSTPVASIYDYYSENEWSWWGGWFEKDGKQYPDNMEKGSSMFSKGYYEVTLEFRHDGGELELGVKNKSTDFSHYNADWCMMDNFRLEYNGEMGKIAVEDFECYRDALEMLPGEKYTLITYVYPTNATERNNVTWKSSNTAVATVDKNGVVTAVAGGTAKITGTCDGHSVEVAVTVMTIDYSGKTWVDVTSEYMTQVDMTSGFDAWNCEPKRVDYEMAEFWNTWFDFNQTVNIPEGYYRFSCEGFFRPTGEAWEAVRDKDTNTNFAYIYGGERETPMLDITSERFTEAPVSGFSTVSDSEGVFYLPNSMEAAKWCFENGYYHYSNVIFHADGKEETKVGIYCNNLVSGQWAIFDNFRLERLMEMVPTTALTTSVSKATLLPGEVLQLELTIKPANATYKTAIWSSSDETVATVDNQGLVTAMNVGTATITATARDNDKLKATVAITVKEEEGGTGALVINEVMSMNVDRFLDPSFNYGGWIELYNPTGKAISLRGCYITEHPDNPKEHHLVDAGVVSAKGYYTIWFDHCDPYFPSQADCKLGTNGGWVAVTSPAGEVMAETEYPAGVQRCSWARKKDGGEEWGYTAQPTPGSTNAASQWATEQLEAPTVDVQGHVFDAPFTVKATWPKGATLRYTTDGSTPTATDGETSTDGIFEIESTTNLRLCAIQDGMMPSAVTTNTYIQRQYDFTIPVISITANNEDIYGADHGIFVRGNGNGRSGNGQSSKCNWNQDWDRPCTFEYFTPEGERSFMQDVDITAAGGWSRAWTPHSFKLKAAKVYGINSMDYPFFETKPYNKHKALQIRNGGNDNGCRFKDPAIQTIIQRSGIYVDGQAYQPVAHYINGKYIGVINMREPNNKHHAYSNYGYDTDYLDQFEISPDSGYVQKTGSIDALMEWYHLAEQAADPDIYKRICDEYVDVDEYINYMACWLWLGNSDWMRNNVKGYRSTETDGKFHFVMFDTDGSFSHTTSFDAVGNMAYRTDYPGDEIFELNRQRLTFELYPATIWMNMLQNDEFRKKFVDAFSMVCGSVFEPTRCNSILDELYNRVQPMMQLNGGSASATYNSLKQQMGSNSRNNSMLNSLKNYYMFGDETSEPINVTFSSNIPEASILYNGMDVPTGKFTGRAFLPVTLEACAPGGYDFKGWMLKSGSGAAVQTPIFPKGSTWAYYDKGSLDGEEWMAANYDDSSWPEGQAPLGYDDGSSAQGVGGLLNTNNLQSGTTFYFRHEFNLASAPAADDAYSLDFILDDGCVVYVNGTEAGRDNMPSGNVGYSTLASTFAYNNPNTGTIAIPAKLLKKGRNVIAVEVHNNSATSSDICWDGGLSATSAGSIGSGDILTTDAELDLYSIESGAELVAVYEPHVAVAGESKLPPVRINEVSAMNDTYANEYFKRNDWLELYNTTDEDIDIAGMYLSDNVDKPHKYQIPTQLESGVSTVVPAHGHVIVWCDKLDNLSQLHAGFKLDGDADAGVMLTAADDSWCDYLNYPAHDRNQSAGRYPDGADNVFLMTTITPAATNRMSSYATQYELQQLQDGIIGIGAEPGGDLGITFDGEDIVVSRMARIELYSAAGEMLMFLPNATRLNTRSLRQGIYVARAKANGEAAVVKFGR